VGFRACDLIEHMTHLKSRDWLKDVAQLAQMSPSH